MYRGITMVEQNFIITKGEYLDAVAKGVRQAIREMITLNDDLDLFNIRADFYHAIQNGVKEAIGFHLHFCKDSIVDAVLEGIQKAYTDKG